MSKHDFTVRILENDGARDLTAFISSLSFGSTDPGGFASVEFLLDRRIDALDFDTFSDIAVFDAATGEQVGGGRLQQPGRGVNEKGDGVWTMSALGEGIAHLQERKVPYFIQEARLDAFTQGTSTSTKRQWSVQNRPRSSLVADDDSTTVLAFVIQQDTGEGIGSNAFTNADFYDLSSYEQEIGGWTCRHIEGTQPGTHELHFEMQLRLKGAHGTTFDAVNKGWSTSFFSEAVGAGDEWPLATLYDHANFVWSHPHSSFTIPSNPGDYWCSVYSFTIQAIRKDRNGNDLPNDSVRYVKEYLDASEIIIDALARFAPRIDLPGAYIVESGPLVTEPQFYGALTFPDGITTYELLDYMMANGAGDYTWAVWEKNNSGKWSFEWRQRDSAVRYELGEGQDIDFDLTGGEFERLTTVWYTGTNIRDRFRAKQTIGTNPYADLNIVPTDTKQLPQDQLSSYDWDQAASLAASDDIQASKYFATAARCTIPDEHWVYDHYKGSWIRAWEIRPGYNARVLRIRSSNDDLNSISDDDDSAIFRVTSMKHDVDGEQTPLELNAYTVDQFRALANLVSKSGGRGR